MVIRHNLRNEFSEQLRIIIAKTTIKQKDIVDAIGKSRQFVSLVVNGASLFTPEQFEAVYELLKPVANPDDLKSLAEKYTFARCNVRIPPEIIGLLDDDPLKIKIIQEIKDLDEKQLIKVYEAIEKIKIKT